MIINFSKYHGAGNDFILIDNRKAEINLSCDNVAFLCNRHFGIGADGLMLLNASENQEFEMKYYNSDGNESTMCGNGGRCITAFASKLCIIKNKATFKAIDGLHTAEITADNNGIKTVKLKMMDVTSYHKTENYFEINTGSPHYVEFVKDVNSIDVFTKGRAIRYDSRFNPGGLNVNFAEVFDDHLFVRTYERGVENETLSCGTGVTASAMAYAYDKDIQKVLIHTLGGKLIVSFEKQKDIFKNVFLEGEASFVFEGEIEI